ncbi:MAG: hypothetical protein IJS63_09045 [Bacteroidaceae bacterium]|nr:hypothetical protein [Bacteroidaceae bacterium]
MLCKVSDLYKKNKEFLQKVWERKEKAFTFALEGKGNKVFSRHENSFSRFDDLFSRHENSFSRRENSFVQCLGGFYGTIGKGFLS